MTFSTRFGVGMSIGGAATTWLSSLVAQATADGAVPAANAIPANMTMAAALATIATSIATVVTVWAKVNDNAKKADDAAKKAEETNKKLDTALADLATSEKRRKRTRRDLLAAQKRMDDMQAGLETTRHDLDDTRQGLATTRSNNHGMRNASQAMYMHQSELVDIVNAIRANQEKIIGQMAIKDPVPIPEAHPLPPISAPPAVFSTPEPNPKG